jgi:hypothetical protein
VRKRDSIAGETISESRWLEREDDRQALAAVGDTFADVEPAALPQTSAPTRRLSSAAAAWARSAGPALGPR